MKLLNKIIVTFILMSVINSVSFGKTNDDIIGHWAENTLNEWIEEEYIRGYPNGEIRPDNHMLKSECVALINRIFGFKIIGDRQFDNINEDHWYSNDFKIAKLAGYLSWMNENQMEINKPITRNEVAAIMAQIYHWDLKNYDNTLKQFKDEKEIPIWARKYVGLAVERGYFKGYPDGTIKSNKVMTRAEIAVFINNILGNRFKENEFVENQIFEGNVTIQEANVILENCEIKGDLLVAESVGDGDLTLENTKVFGRTIANGGGTDSIKIINSQIEELIVLKLDGEVRVFSKNSKIGQTIINSVAKLEGSFENIMINILSANGSVEIDGTCETLIVDSQVHIEVDKQTQINKVILNSESKITGEGTIKLAEINKNGVVVESKIEKAILKKGVELNKEVVQNEMGNNNNENIEENSDDDKNRENDLKDNYEQFVELDNIALNKPIISGIVDGVYGINQKFTIRGEKNSYLEYSLDNGLTWKQYLEEVMISGNGQYKLLARQKDLAGNISEYTNLITFTINKDMPIFINIDDDGGDNNYKSGEELSIIVEMNKSGLKLFADLSVINSAFSSDEKLTDLGNGKYQIIKANIDENGTMINEGLVTITITAETINGLIVKNTSFNLLLDKINPTIPKIEGILSGSFKEEKVFSISGDVKDEFMYSIDNGSNWIPYENEVKLKDGIYNLLAKAIDKCGNESGLTNIINISIDTKEPTIISIQDESGNSYYKHNELLDLVVDFGEVGLEVKADLNLLYGTNNDQSKIILLNDEGNGEYRLLNQRINQAIMNEGEYNIKIIAKDAVGNLKEDNTFIGTLDFTVPEKPVIEGILSGSFKEEKVFSISGDVKDEFMYSIDNGSNWIPYENEVKLKDGIYNLLAKAIDKCGNESGLTNVINISIDTKEPTIISIQDESGNSYYKHNELLDLVVDFGEVGLEVKADLNLLYGTNNDQSKIILLNDEGNGKYRLLNQRINQAIMNEGEYNIKIIAKDAVGNLKEDNTFIGTLDFTVPEKPVITGITSGLFKENQVFEVEGERDSIIEYSLNNGSNWEKYNVIVELINSGDYEILVRQTDLAGNVSAVTNLINITIDKEAPKGYLLQIDELNITPKNKNSIKIQISNCEIGVTYNYNIDDKDENTEAITGTGIINQTNIELNNIDLSSLSDGQITFSIYCVDEAGNIGDYESEIKDKVPYNNVSVIDERDYCNGIYGYFEKRNNKPAYRRFGSPNDEMIIVWEDSGYGIEWALKVYQNDSKRYIAYYYCSEDKPTPPKASPTNKHWYYMDEMISGLTLTE